MTVIKRLWINRCMAEICETSTQEALSVYIHGTEDPEQYQKIKEYLWTEGIMDEVVKHRLGISLDTLKKS
jgi:predicted urease superfamily metal-dependent hydrolase